MKCGYFMYEERNIGGYKHAVYHCRYFSFSANTEEALCKGCIVDENDIPHLEEWE